MARTTNTDNRKFNVTAYDKSKKAWNLGVQLNESEALNKIKQAMENPIYSGLTVIFAGGKDE